MNKSLSKGLGRYAKLGMLSTAWFRSRIPARLASEKARADLIRRLGTLHGLPQKIGQIMALGDLEAEESDLQVLTESAGTVPFSAILNIIEEELGPEASSAFAQIDPEGISASLAQVHPGALADGRKVAVKVQYPGMADAIWADLKAVGWLTAPIGNLSKGFDLTAYREEICELLHRELDYRLEAEMLETFGELTRNWLDVEVPQVIREQSAERVLTMTWLEGEKFDAVRGWSASARTSVAQTLLRVFFFSCLRWQWLHGDPHPGNFRFRQSEHGPVVGLLDFGCVQAIDKRAASALRALSEAVFTGTVHDKPEWILRQYLNLGFDEDLLSPMSHLLPDITEMMLKPLGMPDAFNARAWNMKEEAENLLGDYRWNFRFAGPAKMLVWIRAYQGLLQYLKALDVPVNWRETLWDLFDEIESTPDTDTAGIETCEETMFEEGSKQLRIRISEGARTKVDLTFRAHVVGLLDDIIPDDLKPRIRERGIDLKKISVEAVDAGLIPGELFVLEENGKTVRVWLQ